MNCGGFRNVKITTKEEFEKAHEGHKIERNVRTVKAPGYKVVFDRCADCKVTHGEYQDLKQEGKPR